MNVTVENKRRQALPALIALIACVVLLFSAVAQAAPKKKPQGARPVGAVNSSNGGVYNVGDYGVIFKYITSEKDQLYAGSDDKDFVRPLKGGKPGKKALGKKFDRYQVILRTGIWKDFDARLVIPFWDKKLERQSFNKNFSDDNTGLGDITLFSRYRIFSQKRKDPFNLAIGLGLEMPTGDTDVSDSHGKTPGYLQPGGGAWNPIVELGAHKVMGSHWLASHFLYKMTTEGELGDKDFEKPDVFKYNFSYAYAFSRYLDAQLEINGEVKSKVELAGVKRKNSGGHMVFLSPGIHVKIRKGIHFGFCTPITIYRDVNGEQLTEDYRVVAKLAMKF